jgi:uncharacterized lipoprotein YddW (UPF0748 family)
MAANGSSGETDAESYVTQPSFSLPEFTESSGDGDSSLGTPTSSSDETSSVSASSSNVSSSNASSSNVSSRDASSAAASSAASSAAPSAPPAVPEPSPGTEMRAAWISFYDLSAAAGETGSKSAAKFKRNVRQMFADAKALKMTDVVVHTRAESDAWYPSAYFPWATSLTGQLGKDPGFDPLAFMVTAAHELGLKFHAWINPYRVKLSYHGDINSLAPSNPARIWKTDTDPSNDHWVFQRENTLYYNPAVVEVQNLIINGVREIAARYSVDGIHFDDYFYPDNDVDIDKAAYAAYAAETLKPLSLDDWRRAHVSALVSGVYAAVKAADPKKLFGVSPVGNLDNVRHKLYVDIDRWLANKGYVDYIVPQVYWGFNYPEERFRFDLCCAEWTALVKEPSIKLYFGLAGYKIGTIDANSSEWIDHPDLLKRQVEFIRTISQCSGFMVYSLANLTKSDPLHTEARNLFYSVM